MAKGRTGSRRALALVVLVLAVLTGLTAARATFASDGNAGTVKIHNGAAEPTPITQNHPHVCTFHAHALFFGANQTLSFEVKSWPPTGDRTTVLRGSITTDAGGAGRSPTSGAYSLPDGHYKLFVTTATGQVKHKVFWVQCPGGTTTTTTTVCPTTTTSSTTSTTAVPTTTSGATTTTVKGTTSTGPTTTEPVTTIPSSSGPTMTTVCATTTTCLQGGEPTTAACLSTTSNLAASPAAALVPAGAGVVPLVLGGLVLLGLGTANVFGGRWRRRA